MKQHGFARDLEFEEIEYTDNIQSYLLKSNKTTKEKYPYDFIINVTYMAKENKVTTQYKVKMCIRDSFHMSNKISSVLF